MLGLIFRLYGALGHFKRPETNNNPCTFSLMHKPALIGLIGAVLGIERKAMAPLYPQLCEDLLYAIRLRTKVIKEAYAFTKRKVTRTKFYEQGQRYCEFLKRPDYDIVLGLANDRSSDIFQSFKNNLKAGRSDFPTCFGVASCPCVYEYQGEVDISKGMSGKFDTDAVFSSRLHQIERADEAIDLIYERIPTHIKEGFYTPEKMTQVVCVSGDKVQVSGPYRTYNGGTKAWFM